jgi:sRNA-binding protein
MIPQTIQNASHDRQPAATHGFPGNRVATVAATIAELVRQFPHAFSADPAQMRPLKRGILDDVYARTVVSHRRIKAALQSYCNSAHYLKASTQGTVRIDIAGEPAGDVTAQEAESAQQRLAAKKKKTAIAKITGVVKGVQAPRATQASRPSQPSRAPQAPGTVQTPSVTVENKPTVYRLATSGPQRLSLNDLRAAAAARKAASLPPAPRLDETQSSAPENQAH